MWPAGTYCGTGGQCDGDVVVGAKVCDGRGNCQTGTKICAPYRCESGGCRDSCQMDADCPGSTCTSLGLCHDSIWPPCSNNSECATGFCAQRVCCASVCAAPCWSCNVRGREGTCSIVPGCTLDAGTD